MNQQQVEFTLPRGYVDNNGICHKKGIMRMATAADEILPLKDPRVQQNPSYLPIILLSRVIITLGDLTTIDTSVIESLYSADFNYLQEVYKVANDETDCVVCPNCGTEFKPFEL